MTFTNDTAANAAFKRLYGKAHTSNNKDIVNESEPSTITAAAQTIFADTVPSIGSSAVASGVAVYENIPLVLDGSSDGKSYKAIISGSVPSGLVGKINPLTGSAYTMGDRVGYFIPEFLGQDYRIKLLDGSTEIPPLSEEDWIFDYYSGIITSEDNLSLSSGSVDGYIYTGALASDTAANWMRDGTNIYNRNAGTVSIKNDLIIGRDGYIANTLGVDGDGYVAGRLGIGSSTVYDLANEFAKLYVADGDISIQDTTGNNIPSIDIRSNYTAPYAQLGEIAFGSTSGTWSEKRVAKIAGRLGPDADPDTGELVLSTASAAGSLNGRVFINKNGLVGINAGAPETLLHLLSSVPATTGTTQGSVIRLDYYDLTWTVGDVLGALEWYGNDVSAGATGVRARVQAVAAGTTGATDMRFLTTGASSTTLNTVLSVTNSQRIGVNVTSPDNTMHVMQSDASATSNANSIATFEKNGIGYLQLITPDANENGILFGLSSNVQSGGILYNSSTTLQGLQFRTGGNTTRMVIDSSGQVGLGTTTPNTIFNIYSEKANVSQTQFTQDILASGINMEVDYADGVYTPGIFWSSQNNNASKPKAGIYTQLTGSGSKLFMGTSNSYSTGITNKAIVISYNGNVGLGTSDPQAALHVSATGQQWAVFGADLAAGSYMTLRQPASASAAGYLGTGGGGAVSAATSADVALRSEGALLLASGGNNERIRITSTGTVGVGATSPTARLEVDNGSSSIDVLAVKENGVEVFTIPDGMSAPVAGQVLYAVGVNGNASWGEANSQLYTRAGKSFYNHEDFIGRESLNDGWGIWDTLESGGSIQSWSEDSGHPGLIRISAGTAGDEACVLTGDTIMGLTGSERIDIKCLVKFSSVTQTSNNWSFKFGLSTNTNSDTSGNDEISIRIDPGSNSFMAKVFDNGITRYDDTIGVTAAASTWYLLEITYTNGIVIFQVNGTPEIAVVATPDTTGMQAIIAYGKTTSTSTYYCYADYVTMLISNLGR